MKKEKILIISDGIFPYSMGGSHRLIYELAKNINKKKYDVLCIVPEIDISSNFFLSQKKESNDFDIQQIQIKYKNKVFKFFSSFFIHFKKIDILSLNCDIINIHYLPALFSLRNSISNKKKIYYTFHGPWSEEFSLSILGRCENFHPAVSFLYKIFFKKLVKILLFRIEKYALKNVSSFMCLSNYMKNKLANDFQINKNQIKIINSGIDMKKFDIRINKKFRKEISHQKKNVFITVRRLEKRMGIDQLIRACFLLKKTNSNFILNICGKGNYYRYLEKQIRQYKLDDNIKLLGFVDEDKLPLMISNSDLFILPSIDLEGFGLVILESMACGVPVLCSPIGGSKEIISLVDKSLVMKSVNPKDIRDSILNFLNNETIIKEKKFYRNFVEARFSWLKFSNEYESWIRNL